MEDYIIKRDYKYTIFGIVGGLIALIACVYLLNICYSGDYEPNGRIARNYYLVIIVSCLGIFFAILGVFSGIYIMIFKPIVLRLSEQGLEDHSALMSLGFIPWCEVDSITVLTVFTETMIGVRLVKDSVSLQKAPFYKRLLIAANVKAGFPPIGIPIPKSKAKIVEVALLMKQFHEASKSKS